MKHGITTGSRSSWSSAGDVVSQQSARRLGAPVSVAVHGPGCLLWTARGLRPEAPADGQYRDACRVKGTLMLDCHSFFPLMQC